MLSTLSNIELSALSVGGKRMENLAIRERLGAYLATSGATKQSVADSLGVTTVTLNSKLKGESEFSLSQAFALADLIGCSADDLRKRPQ